MWHMKTHDSGKIKRKLERQLEMWANAQRDGRPAKYRWRPALCSTP